MRLSLIRALVFAFIAAVVIAPLSARAVESHVWVNNTTDKSVWVTASFAGCGGGFPLPGGGISTPICTDRHILHEWCTAPGQSTKHGFHEALRNVRILVTAHANCGRPILKEWDLNFPRNNGSQSIKQQYNVTKNGASYDVQAVP